MKTYTRNFKKTVWGYGSVEADSLEEAQRLFDEGEQDEFDNQSDYEWEENIEERD